MDIRLNKYAKLQGITYQAAWIRWNKGQIPGAYRTSMGRVMVPLHAQAPEPKVAIYTRVSSSENKGNLEGQVARLEQYALAKGWQVVSITKEVGSGLNEQRPKLDKLLRDTEWNILLVEHKDRLTRFGFTFIDTLLEQQGKRVEVANLADEGKADLIQDLVSVVYSFSARLYGLRRARKTAQQIMAVVSPETVSKAGE